MIKFIAMNTKPSELKRLIETRGLSKAVIARNIGVPAEYINHAINPKSSRFYTDKIEETKEKIYSFLIQLKAIL